MEANLRLNIYELRQVMADGTLAALAESICSLEGKSLDQAKKEHQIVNQQNALESQLPGQMQMDVPQPVPAVNQVQQTVIPVQQATPVQAPVITTVPTQNPAPVALVTAVPTTVQAYSMEQLAIAATQLMDAGRKDEVVNLLGQFGVQALTLLPKEQYGAFAIKLRELGAKI